MRPFLTRLFAALIFSAIAAPITHAQSAAEPAAPKPYLVEWLYRVQYGHKDEWWALFRKYQIAALDREQQLGYITSYTVYAPGLHTAEDGRWDYRIVIAYKDPSSATHEGEVLRQLFPDQATLRKEENRRWELTSNHYDLPIHAIDPHAE
jgi:hypothetical protein